MTKFYAGQDVEVCELLATEFIDEGRRRKAKIVKRGGAYSKNWIVQFHDDGSRAVFDAEHIRAAPFEDSWLGMTSRTSIARPSGSNADEWAVFLSENMDPDSIPYVAAQIAAAIETATATQEMFDIGDGLAVSFNPRGRFHGWLSRQHPDGYVLVRKLNKLQHPDGYVLVRKLNKLEPFA